MDDKGFLYTIPLGFKQYPLEDASILNIIYYTGTYTNVNK